MVSISVAVFNMFSVCRVASGMIFIGGIASGMIFIGGVATGLASSGLIRFCLIFVGDHLREKKILYFFEALTEKKKV